MRSSEALRGFSRSRSRVLVSEEGPDFEQRRLVDQTFLTDYRDLRERKKSLLSDCFTSALCLHQQPELKGKSFFSVGVSNYKSTLPIA